MITDEPDFVFHVRAGDYDRFLAIQLAPGDKRPALYAVTALHGELARIAEMVSEGMLGHIRLAWWREALDEIIAGRPPRNHPVVLAMAALFATHPQIFPHLYDMIDARAADLDASLLEDEQAWRDYLDHTAGALHRSWGVLLDEQAADRHTEAIALEARSYALIGLLRAIPYQAAHGFHRFPPARLAALEPSPALQTSVQEMTREAVQWMAQSARLPRSLLPLEAMAALARSHAHALAKTQGNPYAQRASSLRAAWAVTRTVIKQKLCIFT